MGPGVTLLHGDRGNPADGIRDYTRRLAQELAGRPLAVSVLRLGAIEAPDGESASPIETWQRLKRASRSSVIVLQYNPFCYARRGFAPWLPAALLALRAGGRRPAVALMIHEPYVPMTSWRLVLMGSWQRLQLLALRYTADVVFASIEPWAEQLAATHPRRPVHHLPVGSNFPDARADRESERARLELDDRTLAIACLGRDHPSWLGGYAVATANAVIATGQPVALLLLGANAPAVRGLDPRVRLIAPGFLERNSLARKLAAADLFLAPTIDGVSTRRGSLMAALQHGLPVVGTEGPLTDSILREATPALRLTAVGDRLQFAAAAAELAADPAARVAAASAARALYEREFDWPLIADRLLANLPDR